jgi:DNA-binding CsgD family transcriptional regulator
MATMGRAGRELASMHSDGDGTGHGPAELLRVRRLLDEAARLLANAGGDALRMGRSGAAADLLSRACDLLEVDDYGADGPAHYAAVLETLLTALIQAGRLRDAGELAGRVEELACVGLAAERLAALRARLAWAASCAGDRVEAAAQLAMARGLNPLASSGASEVLLDALSGRLAAEVRRGDATAEELSRRGLGLAMREDLPEVACLAWEALGILARFRDIAESGACFERMGALARQRRLVYWGLLARLHLGTNDWLVCGDTTRLGQVLRAARRLGAAAVACSAMTVMALDFVLTARFPEAGEIIERCQAEAGSLGLTETLRWLAMVRAALAGQQGRRRKMDTALEEFRERGGEGSRLEPLTLGLAKTFCALLEEDRAEAVAELDRVAARGQGSFPIAGTDGLRVLLSELSNEGRPVASAGTATAGWNRQFLLFARAVRLGREGESAAALDVVAQAERAAARYPLARHLGLRLVAEAAYRDGWGHPVDWLRGAEEYFHACSVPAVAGAARSLLRQIGAPPRQRRTGADRIPPVLRTLGVSVREYEVLRLLVTRFGNRAIAAKLHISHRTVEKHVANLLMKLGQPNRTALSDQASALLASSENVEPA